MPSAPRWGLRQVASHKETAWKGAAARRRSCRPLEQAHGKSHDLTLLAKRCLAQILLAQGKGDAAERIFEDLLSARGKAGEDTADALVERFNLAVAPVALGDMHVSWSVLEEMLPEIRVAVWQGTPFDLAGKEIVRLVHS